MGSVTSLEHRTKTSSPGGTWLLWERSLSRVTCSHFAGGPDSLLWETFQMEAARLPVGAEGDLPPTPTVTCCRLGDSWDDSFQDFLEWFTTRFPYLKPVLCAINQVIRELNTGCVSYISSPLTAGPCGKQSLVGWQSWEEVMVRAERHRGGGGAEEGCQVLGLIGHRTELDFIPRGGSEVKWSGSVVSDSLWPHGL